MRFVLLRSALPDSHRALLRRHDQFIGFNSKSLRKLLKDFQVGVESALFKLA
jgi:hypothetical protein